MAQRMLNTPSENVMIEGLFNQPNYLATKKMLDATVLRHEAIASNLANIETPQYKRVDVNSTFAEELRRATSAGDAQQIQSLQPKVGQDLTAVAANKDGNTVQLENELMQLNQNTVAHTLETQLVTGALAKLRLAITGRNI